MNEYLAAKMRIKSFVQYGYQVHFLAEKIFPEIHRA